MKTSVGSFTSQYRFGTDGRTVVDRVLKIDKSVIAPPEFPALAALYNAVWLDSQAKIIINKAENK